MRKVFVDLEMNPIRRIILPSGRIMKQEVIEIGAVAMNEDGEIIGKYSEYVRPVHNDRIDPFITQLTGITFRNVEKADTFPAVFRRFLSWCGDDYEIYSWSDNDLDQMRKECEEKGIDEICWADRWQDFQTEFSGYLGYERRMKLSEAVNVAGLDFQGRAHGALADAENTAALYLETKKENFKTLVEEVHGGNEEIGVSLGSLFDFAALAV